MKDIRKSGYSDACSKFASDNQQFIDYGPSLVALKVLRFIEDSRDLSHVLKNHHLTSIIAPILNDLALSELESVVWTIYIEKHFGFEAILDLYHFFLFTALGAKKHLTGDIEYLKEKFQKSNPKFLKKFNSWLEENECLEITLKEINKRFQEINEKLVFGVNYNFYVDSILAYSQAYELGKAKNKVVKKRNKLENKKQAKSGFYLLPKVCKFSSDVPLFLSPHKSLSLSNKSSVLSDHALESFLFTDETNKTNY